MPIIVNVSDAITHTLLTQIQQDGEQSKLYLEYIAQALRQTNILLQSILEIETSNNGFLSQIEINTAPILQLLPPDITGGVIRQIGPPNMALLPIAPGNSPQFQVTPTPANHSPAVASASVYSVTGANGGASTSGAVATQNASDPTGLTVTVAIPTAAPIPFNDLLVWTYTNASGVIATASFALVDSTQPTVDITGGTIVQVV